MHGLGEGREEEEEEEEEDSDLNKKYTYDKLTNETIDVGDMLMEKMPICSHLEASIMAAILVVAVNKRN